MNVSQKVDAEFINRAVFKITDLLYERNSLYKIGFLTLSGRDKQLEVKIKYVDFLIGRIDSYIIEGKKEKALVYTTLLKKRVNDIIKEINVAQKFYMDF